MPVSAPFLRLSAFAAFVTVLTTLGVHLISVTPASFEASVQLYKNPWYNVRLWLVVAHCALVVVSMYGVALPRFRTAPGLIGLGLLGYLGFAAAETVRMFCAMHWANGLRRRYDESTDEAVRQFIRLTLEQSWPAFSTALFTYFIAAFAVGNFCYGAALWRTAAGRADRVLGSLLLLWAAEGIFVLVATFYPQAWSERPLEIWSLTFQPAVRAAIGMWLWHAAGRAGRRETGLN